jgi:hypothetical protein
MQLSSIFNKKFSSVTNAEGNSGLQLLSTEDFAWISGGDFPPVDRVDFAPIHSAPEPDPEW